jgi:hypothetical protein
MYSATFILTENHFHLTFIDFWNEAKYLVYKSKYTAQISGNPFLPTMWQNSWSECSYLHGKMENTGLYTEVRLYSSLALYLVVFSSYPRICNTARLILHQNKYWYANLQGGGDMNWVQWYLLGQCLQQFWIEVRLNYWWSIFLRQNDKT